MQDVGLHLHVGWTDEKDLHSLEFRQQIGEGPGCAAKIQLPNEGDAQSLDGPLAINRVQVKQRLRWMLAAVAIPCIDDGHRRHLRRTSRSANLMMAYHDGIAV